MGCCPGSHSRVRAGKRMESPPLQQQPGPSLPGAPIASVCCVSAMHAPRASVSLKQRTECIGEKWPPQEGVTALPLLS